MNYTALYRRFRPGIFGELVGQDHISRILAAAVIKGSFVHAYLFCGPRGTGKTSTAKILAKAVNCLTPTAAGEPCNSCTACLRSQRGESLDILEIDAASNRGIDEIRDLRERVKYAPALERYKVYIIDEVHMLTMPAFNALLKTLEEPPAHVIFVLATTEPHKIPLTVLSRCQRFDFRRIADAEVVAHLQAVAEREGYDCDPAALQLIARKVEGGMRDALGILDQCAGFNAGIIDQTTVQTILGAVNQEFIARMTEQILAGDVAALLQMVEELHAEGLDLRQFLHDLLEYQRELLLLKLSPSASEALPIWAQAASAKQLVPILQSLADADGRLRHSLQPRLTLELALVMAAGLDQAAAVKVAAKPQSEPVAKAVAAKQQAAATKPADPPPLPDQAHADILPPAKEDIPPPPEAVADTTAVEPAENQLEHLQELWPQIVREVSREHITTGSFLQEARLIALKGDKLHLCFAAEYALFRDSICNPGSGRDLVMATIERFFGRKLQLVGELAAAKAPATEKAPPADDEEPASQGSLF